MSSLAVITEIVGRIEDKVDKIDSNVESVVKRVAELEQNNERTKAQLSLVKWGITAVITPLLLMGANKLITSIT